MTTAAMQATPHRAVEIEGERPSWNWCRWLAAGVNGITELHRRLARGYRNPMPSSSQEASTAPRQ